MKLIVTLLAVCLLLAAACRQDSGRSDAGRSPQTVEEYTQAIVKEVQQVILSTDQQLREYPPESQELATEEGQALALRLWTEEGNPVKLTAAAPGGQGRLAFYFANGELFFAALPGGARFIFIDGALKYRLDENWKPVAAPAEERAQQEQLLPEQAKKYLRAFEEQ